MLFAMEAKPSAETAGPTRHALYLNEVSRTLACHAPAAAQKHGASFSQLVPSVVRWGNEAPFGRPANVLWGHDSNRPAPGPVALDVQTFLPASYVLSNPICAFCSIPIVPGVNAQHIPKSQRSRGRAHSASLAIRCHACRKPQYRRKPMTAKTFPAVRKRPSLKQLLSSTSSTLASTAPKASRTPSAPAPTKLQAPTPTSRPSAPSVPRPEQRPPKSNRAPSAPFQDTKAGLRALLQQKKQKDQASNKPPKSGGLADFLSQL